MTIIHHWRTTATGGVAQWRLEARRHRSISRSREYTIGGQQRKKKPEAITLPRLKCLDEPETGQ